GTPGCAQGCEVHILDAHGGTEVGTARLPEYASDVAVENTSGQPVVAFPGRGALTWLDSGSAMPTDIQAIQARAQVVVANGAALVGFAGGDTLTDSSCMPPTGGAVKPSAMVVVTGGGEICSGSVFARDEFVMLVDLASGVAISVAATQEAVGQCHLDCGPIPLDCRGTAPLPRSPFVATGVSVLFGGK